MECHLMKGNNYINNLIIYRFGRGEIESIIERCVC